MRIVVATTFLPSARTSGADIATDNVVEALRVAGHQVTVLGYTAPSGKAQEPWERSVGPATGEWHCARPATRLRWVLAALACGRAVSSQKFRSPAYLRVIRESSTACDAWLVDHHHLDWLAPPTRLPTVAVAHNLEHRLIAEQADLLPLWSPRRCLLAREAKAIARAESACLDRSDIVWALAEADAAALSANGKRAVVLPLPGLPPPIGPPPAPTHDIGILGLWTWEPNRRGLLWFLEQVVPLLPSSVSIAIAGRGCDDLPTPPQVRMLGFVDDACAFQRSSRILAIPSTAGSGIQIKSINAIALGIPTVATAFAMRSLDPLPHWVQIANTAEEMAACLCSALRDAKPDPGAGAVWRRTRAERLVRIVDDGLRSIAAASPA